MFHSNDLFFAVMRSMRESLRERQYVRCKLRDLPVKAQLYLDHTHINAYEQIKSPSQLVSIFFCPHGRRLS